MFPYFRCDDQMIIFGVDVPLVEIIAGMSIILTILLVEIIIIMVVLLYQLQSARRLNEDLIKIVEKKSNKKK